MNTSTNKPIVVSLQKVTKSYELGTQRISALNDISFEIYKGDFIALSGPSGSGKSTLLNMVTLLDTPDSGRIIFAGKDASTLPDKKITTFRSKEIGIVFQNYNLIPVLSAVENVAFPLQLQGISQADVLRRAKQILDRVGLASHYNHRPSELSGGQRQRVAIARALVTEPELIVADEPTAALDSKTGMEVITLMQELNVSANTTFLFSTHDPRITSIVSNVVKMVDGTIITRNGTQSEEK